jgi:hypothetical protein
MTRKRKPEIIPHRNRSPYGWWIAQILERFEYYDEDRANVNRRCLAWENTVLLKARTRDEAYRKALAEGRLSEGSEAWDMNTGRKGAWRFEGLTLLLPVYAKLEDGAEVLWTEYAGKTVRRIKAMVVPKERLGVFDDTE